MTVRKIHIYNLPTQPTTFVGRKSEITDIVNRLQDEDCRLLTLVGSGGIGKTRLAVESIQYLTLSDFQHGVYYVPLAPVTSAENIVTTIISVLGILIGDKGTSQEELVKFLSQRNLLLVMDNFEHLLDGSSIIADILNVAPNVKALVTSRETLNLRMEYVFQVHGMGYPNIQEPEDINQYDALNLFIERALQIRRDFPLGDEQLAVIQICQLVDGLPLAIELAASWLRMLSCNDIIKQIEQGIDFLVTRNRDIADRHRSIRAVFDHSWDMLSDEEQLVFPRLSVFRGGFTLEAAEQIASVSLYILSGLIEKSMVRHDSNGRYSLHELIRQYGEEKLINLGDLDNVNDRHLAYFARFMEQRVPDLQGRGQLVALDEIRADFDNITITWQMACKSLATDKIDQMLECVNLCIEVIGYFTVVNEMYALAIRYLEPIPDTDYGLKNRLKIYALYAHYRQIHTAKHDQKLNDFSHLLSISEKYDDKLATLMCLIMLTPPDVREHSAHLKRLLDLGSSLNTYYLGMTLDQICHIYTILKNENSQATLNYLNRYLSLTQSINDIDGIATAYSYLAQHTRFWGDIDDALYYYDKAIQGFQLTHNLYMIPIYKNLKIFMMLKKGEFNYVLRELPQGIEQLTQVGAFANHVYMNMMMSKAEALLGNYERSQDYIRRMRSLPPDERPRMVFHIIEVQAMISIGFGDFDRLRQKLTEALQVDTSVIATRLMLDFLPLVAFLYHHDRKFTKAVELLGLIFTHPLATRGWMEKWALLSQLRETLQHELGEHTYTSVWERGKLLDLDKMLAEIQVYVDLEPSAKTLPQPLVDPLTKRELEVLDLLGEGQSNHEIAMQLTVTIGTVKRHVYQICQKLAVKNRTQAVLEAKQIGLL